MRKVMVLGCAALLAGCSAEEAPQGQQGGTKPTETVAAEDDQPAKPGAAPLQVTLPQLAYSYRLGFTLPDARLAEAQDAHQALCEKLGPTRCQLVALDRSAANGGASLKLRVAVADVRAFTAEAGRIVSAAGGRTTDTKVTGEDVSKEITDTGARIRQRELLVARLTEMLRTRKGSVAELVEAERTVANAQEELDKARAWLTELRGRVAMADVQIDYSGIAAPASATVTTAVLGEAVHGSAALFVSGLQTLLWLAIYLLPWAAIFGGGAAIVVLLRRRGAVPPQA